MTIKSILSFNGLMIFMFYSNIDEVSVKTSYIPFAVGFTNCHTSLALAMAQIMEMAMAEWEADRV